MLVGVDTGGTFTDFVWLDEHGAWRVHKQLSTPPDPSLAILSGLANAEETKGLLADADLVHGSTVATNAVLERKGARTALVATAGFEDVLAIGRQNRPELYALVPQKPPPLIPRQWRFGIQERVTASGEVLIPLDVPSLAILNQMLASEGIQSVAVSFLFSFLHPEHETLVRDEIVLGQEEGELPPDLHISLSSDILPEYREYERTATTVLNAYVAPLMSGYLRRLQEKLAPRRVAVMQSNGGVISADTAGAQAARTLLSGPAGGVVGAHFVASSAGFDEIITFDMGGTSTDVALCPGRLPTTTHGEIAGLPLRLPIVDIHTVGSGGGSLAYVDAGGALHVGPQSAGANPGPACYGLSDVEPRATTTDANLILGRLSPDRFLGGAMRLSSDRARQALAATAAAIGVATAEEAAWDVIQVANATMERAIRRISVERGFDPRRFTLVAFGGAGPLHACELAERLQIPRVLIPPAPGVLSALGMLVAAPAKDYSQTAMIRLDENSVERLSIALAEHFLPIRDRALSDMAAEGYAPPQVIQTRYLDMRYLGQSHEIPVPVSAADSGHDLAERFHQAHEQRYGYRHESARMEIVTLRLQVQAIQGAPAMPELPPAGPGSSPPAVDEAGVWFASGPQRSALYERSQFRSGHRLSGPAIIFQYDTTTVLPPDWNLTVDIYGNLVLEYHQ
jgi:N-methylhydantoinase A